MNITPLKKLADALRKNGLDIAAVHGNTPNATLYRAFATRLDNAIAEALAMPDDELSSTTTPQQIAGSVRHAIPPPPPPPPTRRVRDDQRPPPCAIPRSDA